MAAPTRKLCPREGHFPFNKGCANAYYKCHRDMHGALQGYLFKCPNGRIFSSVSRRCERNSICKVLPYKRRNNTRININIHDAPSKGVYITYQQMFYVGLTPLLPFPQIDKNYYYKE